MEMLICFLICRSLRDTSLIFLKGKACVIFIKINLSFLRLVPTEHLVISAIIGSKFLLKMIILILISDTLNYSHSFLNQQWLLCGLPPFTIRVTLSTFTLHKTLNSLASTSFLAANKCQWTETEAQSRYAFRQ